MVCTLLVIYRKEWLKKHDADIVILDGKIKSYVLAEDLQEVDDYSKELGQKVDKLIQKIDSQYSTKDEIFARIDQVELDLHQNFITKPSFHLFWEKQKTEFTKTNAEIEIQKEYLQRVETEMRNLTTISAKNTDIKSIKQKMENLCKYEDLKALYNKV